ncbi:hypothetical protein [Sphaerospermopsis sp. LEGE 08334]|jgi:hypothetical protein|nr:hypothetical protein [Sphaerospermopsis sp. LEGE 08334]
MGYTIPRARKAIAQFPSLNPDILRSRIEKFIEHCENNLEENQS